MQVSRQTHNTQTGLRSEFLSQLLLAYNVAGCHTAECNAEQQEADLLLTEQGNSETVSLFLYGLRAKRSPFG